MAKKNKKEKKNTIKSSKKIVRPSFWQDRSLWLPALVVLVITFLIFSPSIGNDFVNWDDDVNILENANVLEFNIKGIFTESVIGGYNPLTTLYLRSNTNYLDLIRASFIWSIFCCI